MHYISEGKKAIKDLHIRDYDEYRKYKKKPPYAYGLTSQGTIMTNSYFKSGSPQINYYSFPKLYSKENGMPLGEEGKIDMVRAMNKNAVHFSNIR